MEVCIYYYWWQSNLNIYMVIVINFKVDWLVGHWKLTKKFILNFRLLKQSSHSKRNHLFTKSTFPSSQAKKFIYIKNFSYVVVVNRSLLPEKGKIVCKPHQIITHHFTKGSLFKDNCLFKNESHTWEKWRPKGESVTIFQYWVHHYKFSINAISHLH